MFASRWRYESGPLKVTGQFSRRDHTFCSGGSPGYLRAWYGVELMIIFTMGCEMIGEYRDRQDLLKAD